jgi:hypothetical protein
METPTSEELEQIIADHPMLTEAKRHPYGAEGIVTLEERSDVEWFLTGESIEWRALEALGSEENVLELIYMTSETKPIGPLCADGIIYRFLFHPKTREFLGAVTGQWIS